MKASPVLAISLVLVFATFLRSAYSADPDPVRDFPTGLSTFTLRNIFKNGIVSKDTGGTVALANSLSFPALGTQGLAVARLELVPCGSQLPHTHPRASEILSVISGGPVQVGFVDTTGASHIDILYPGDVTIIPRGMLHFILNVGILPADILAALNSERPGAVTSSEGLFKIPLRAVAISLNVDIETVTSLNSTMHQFGPGLKKTAKSGCVPGKDITKDF